jgi:hypothetical protein
MLNNSAFESEYAGNPDIFFEKNFTLVKDAKGNYTPSSVALAEQVLQVVKEAFPRAQGLKVSDKGELFAQIPYIDTLFSVQAFPTRASTHAGAVASSFTVILESKVPKLEEAAQKYKILQTYFMIGGAALIGIIGILALQAPASPGTVVKIKISSIFLVVGLGGAFGAFLGRTFGGIWFKSTLKNLVAGDAFTIKQRLERKLKAGIEAVVVV